MAIDIDFAKIQAEINRQRGTGNRSTVSDLAPGIDMLLKTIQDIPRQRLEVEKWKHQKEGYDLQNISRFESRMDNRLTNFQLANKQYDNKEIDQLKQSLQSEYDNASVQNPHLIPEYESEHNAALGQINVWQTKNQKLDLLTQKIQPTKDKLNVIAQTLGTTQAENMTAQDRNNFREQIRDAVEDVVKLDALVEDGYYSGLENWNNIRDDVKYGIKDLSQQLINQVYTWQTTTEGDPTSMYVINKNEMDTIDRALINNDLTDLIKITDGAVKDKTTRTNRYIDDFNASVKAHKAITSFTNSTTFKELANKKQKEFNELMKKNQDISDDFWIEYIPESVLPDAPDEGINIKNYLSQQMSLEAKAEELDNLYRNEHFEGKSISEVYNVDVPWAKKDKPFVPSFTGTVGESLSEEQFDALQELQTPPIGETEEVQEDQQESVETDVSIPKMNNPGNLKFANQPLSTGQTDVGFATFATPEDGFQALYNQIEADKSRGDTLKEFIYGKPNDPNDLGGYSEDNREEYVKNLSKWLNLSPKSKISTVPTKKLANAIAKQEGWKGDFPEVKEEVKIKGEKQLTILRDGKVKPNMDVADYVSFKEQQNNLKKIASKKFNTKENKKEYKNINNFVKSKFEQFLRETNRYGKGFTEGDYKYFYPTKVNKFNQIDPNPDKNIYNLYYEPAFSGAEKGKDIRMFIKPRKKGMMDISDSYVKFAKDFDDFRKFLKES